MWSILEIDKIILFILFIIPGFISLKTYALFSVEKKDSLKQIIDALTYSCLNYALVFPFILYIEKNISDWNYLFYSVILFFLPIFWGVIWFKIRLSNFCTKNIPHPIGKPWDYVFSKNEEYWVVVTLKNGKKIGGKYSVNSFSSSAPNEEQIYLEETWVLNECDGFERPRKQSRGIIILNDIELIELFDFNYKGEEND